MFARRLIVVALAGVALLASVLAQEVRLGKAEERAKFHSQTLRPTSPEDREKAYRLREQMKAASPFGGLSWRNLGPEIQGGRVIDIEGVPNDPNTVLVAFATGGLWRTRDQGITWESLFDNQSAYGIGAIGSSRDGKTLWVGTGEANSQRTSYSGTGVFKSTDAGKTWQNVGLRDSHHIGRLTVDPKNDNVVYVAAMGPLYSQNTSGGLYRTRDGGKSWRRVLPGNATTGAIDVVVNPQNPRIVTAVLWDRQRRAWNFLESGPGSRVVRSTDGGDTWKPVVGLPTGDAAGRIGLAVAASRPQTMIALVDNQADDADWFTEDEFTAGGTLTPRRFLRLNKELFLGLDAKPREDFWKRYGPADTKIETVVADLQAGKVTFEDVRKLLEKRNPALFQPDLVEAQVFRSEDAGATWQKVPRDRLGGIGGYYWGKVAINPQNPDDIYAMGVPLMRSKDGGKSWKVTAPGVHVDFHALWWDPRFAETLWMGNDGGVYVSSDGGEKWRHLNTLPVAQATTLALDDKTPYNVYIGLQDNGTMKGPVTYRPGESDLTDWTMIFGGDGSHIAVDPRGGGDLVYIAYQFGEHFAIDQKGGQRWRTRAEAAKGEPEARYNWISPLIISPHHPDILYLGSQRVYRSFNQGRKWEPISPDLTKNLPNGDVPHSTIKDLSESPLRFGQILAGTDDGNVRLTVDGGVSWRNIDTPRPDLWVSRVICSRHDVNRLYVTQNGYREDEFASLVWRSDDLGKTWRNLAEGLPAEHVQVVREDPKDPNLLYVGTSMGVYVTMDAGKTWETLHAGLPNLPVHDLAVQAREDDLVAATHARGAFVISLKPLRKLTPELRSKPLAILSVPTVTGADRWPLDRVPIYASKDADPDTYDAAVWIQNPGKVELRLVDKEGKSVWSREFSAVRGLQTFTFDLRLKGVNRLKMVPPPAPKTPAEALADPYVSFRPEYVKAGDYTLEIVQGDQKASEKLKIGN